jgi:hypothetical protein
MSEPRRQGIVDARSVVHQPEIDYGARSSRVAMATRTRTRPISIPQHARSCFTGDVQIRMSCADLGRWCVGSSSPTTRQDVNAAVRGFHGRG